MKKIIALGMGVVAAALPTFALAASYNNIYSNYSSGSEPPVEFFIVFMFFYLLFIAAVIACKVIWAVMLFDAIKRQNWLDESQRSLWATLFIVGAFLGVVDGVIGLVYYFTVKKQYPRNQEFIAMQAGKPSK